MRRFLTISLLATLLQLGCNRAHTPYAYRNADPEQLYAVICHDGKRTIRVPSEDWMEHRAHGDYRGPCRTRQIAGRTADEVKTPKHSVTGYANGKAVRERHRLAWEYQQMLIDSTALGEQ